MNLLQDEVEMIVALGKEHGLERVQRWLKEHDNCAISVYWSPRDTIELRAVPDDDNGVWAVDHLVTAAPRK